MLVRPELRNNGIYFKTWIRNAAFKTNRGTLVSKSSRWVVLKIMKQKCDTGGKTYKKRINCPNVIFLACFIISNLNHMNNGYEPLEANSKIQNAMA